MYFQVDAARNLAPGVVRQIARYRYMVFVERLGWQLDSRRGIELDEFDRPDTVYVVARGSDGAIIGISRLLPTLKPYLLGKVFPQLMGGELPPCSPDVLELSRFAAGDLTRDFPSTASHFSSPIAIELLLVSLAAAAERGARSLISVSPVGVERLLSRAGFRARRVAPASIIDGRALVACLIECHAERRTSALTSACCGVSPPTRGASQSW